MKTAMDEGSSSYMLLNDDEIEVCEILLNLKKLLNKVDYVPLKTKGGHDKPRLLIQKQRRNFNLGPPLICMEKKSKLEALDCPDSASSSDPYETPPKVFKKQFCPVENQDQLQVDQSQPLTTDATVRTGPTNIVHNPNNRRSNRGLDIDLNVPLDPIDID